ncbi:MAG: TonB family protein [Chitinophagaceae bacterium]|nr:TonB family protein [Chitinophagaceae bacterium]
MKNSLCLILLLSLSVVLFSQKSKKQVFQFWDSAGKVVREKDARYLTRIRYVNDTCWQFQHYEMMSPMISSGEYKDKDGTVRHGRSSFMRIDGTLDSTGHFVNNKPDGTWLYFSNNGRLATKKEYSMGDLLSTWNASDKIDHSNKPDVEAQFPGSNMEWQRYLIRNLRYPEYAMGRQIQGNVEMYFQIDAEGNVQDEILIQSVEFTLDNEALRLLRESRKWIPANKNGQKIASYKQQGIAFKTF